MSTIDMTQVAGLQAVNEEGQVIGTLSVDDLTELVATKIVQEAKNEAVSARSASVMSEASTLAATDEYEDQLELDTNPAYVRSLDSDGNPKRTATTSLATVVGGLIGTATSNKDGLLSKNKFLFLGRNELIGQNYTISIKNINRGSDIEIIIANGPSWSTEKPNIILLHSSFDSGNPNITVWKIMEGLDYSKIKIYKRGQDIYIPNIYQYSTRFSIKVISDDYNTISVSSAITSDLNLLEEEKLSIG